MYTMKEACKLTNLSYETLKYYCNEGLIPNVKRDKNNYRIFTDKNIEWITSLSCLKNCGMSISEMKEYLDLCLKGPSTIPQRQKILAIKKQNLIKKQQELQKSIDFIDWKENFYSDVLTGKTKYISNLIDVEEIKNNS